MDNENRFPLATLRSAIHGAPVTLLPANRATPRDRSRIINAAYADYFVPTRISETQMRRMDEIYDVDLARSVAARAGDAWAGMAMLSHRGARGWISSVGVVPAWRRRGVARAMMARLLASAHDLRLEDVTLEVIDRNDPARGFYESLGFRVARELLSWRRSADADALPAPDERLLAALPDEMLTRYFGWHTEPPSWQRDVQTLRYLEDGSEAVRLAAPDDPAQTAGYLFYSDLGDRLALLDVGMDPQNGGVRAARAMLQALIVLNAGKALSISNVPVDDPLNRALAALGFTVYLRQHEMRYVVG